MNNNDITMAQVEAARQLVEKWKANYDAISIEDRQTLDFESYITNYIASALAEAATQGQVVGLEQAAKVANGKRKQYATESRLAEEAADAKPPNFWAIRARTASTITDEIRALSPDPSYLDRVRNEAATAALEQAAQVVETEWANISVGKYADQAEYERLHVAKAIRALQPTKHLSQEWQPMSTAPKNGTEILLIVRRRAGIRRGMLVGHYMPGGHCIEDHPAIDEGWYFWNGLMFDKASEPVRWMPLPSDAAIGDDKE